MAGSVVAKSLPAGPVTKPTISAQLWWRVGHADRGITLLTGQPPAAALGLGIAIPVLILGLPRTAAGQRPSNRAK